MPAMHLNRIFNRGLLTSLPREQWSVLTARACFNTAIVAAAQAVRASADGGGVMAVDMAMPILVVDDYGTMIRIIRNLLRQLGFQDVDDAMDGSIALTKMQSKKYGLVISDWNMEPMTGFELLKHVRSDPNLSETRFIMVTAESKTENVIAAKQAGVNHYIVKPFNADTLKHKIDAVFAA
jgi:two-component system chemotaxis response regulator CheY